VYGDRGATLELVPPVDLKGSAFSYGQGTPVGGRQQLGALVGVGRRCRATFSSY